MFYATLNGSESNVVVVFQDGDGTGMSKAYRRKMRNARVDLLGDLLQ